MLPEINQSCDEMIEKWKLVVMETGSAEVDVWPSLEDLSGDVISRTAFGSNYEEGRRIFILQKEQVEHTLQLMKFVVFPGWRYLPIKANKRMNTQNDDLLETTSSLIVWTLIMLSTHPEWQTRAREEVVQAFGSRKPDFDGLNHLKIVTMVLQEVLRLYPPAPMLTRSVPKDAKLGNVNLPAGIIFAVPDSLEFRPERFSGGVSSATKGKFSYVPFGGGPRICIGQNFAMVEAKVALSMILQHFEFQLSPSYVHAPFPIVTLQPQHGAINNASALA
ncbi:hypothetical protein POM88_009071 [Heracleum sosnowskyi]|uniref:Cytochrome P450 n=1 Tax=Heracleum sosnowskyi TaxID=360622 RepID=A0AAD8J9Y7_9APIA|nr:hypothetical protein POM88_009071 [Heracleum sosnowskyi]